MAQYINMFDLDATQSLPEVAYNTDCPPTTFLNSDNYQSVHRF